ncbi:39S ribosomal protein L50, mitochondrial-like [Rhincodon typus]|uniref:39S ribosomal protein L50, mitochondrial-like n=1 Tax=Rhincodon typus TaxID=259920 RepID=UPI002030AA0F|nr:39S ribosomal protein L50, mitochondrial-like [Rhincodon typus]
MAALVLAMRLRLGSVSRGLRKSLSSSFATGQQGLEDPSLVMPPFRSRKYQPPDQLEERVRAAVERVTGSPSGPDWREAQLDEGQRFRLLRELAQELNHTVPNSQLHQTRSPGELLRFYQQPVEADPFAFQELAHSKLPPNVRITWAYEG